MFDLKRDVQLILATSRARISCIDTWACVYAYYEIRFELTNHIFCITKYELVRTTEFIRICVTNIIRKTVGRG